ncbi:MAG: NADH-quinone oxidoreductase subunit NuoE [Burkholderiales bacterium]|nr:NADH-quinone oxidoreductase subunit NuoE [Burkholderiales bacterium]
MNAPLVLSPESLAAIDREVAKFPPGKQRSAVIAALRIAQQEKRWVSNSTMDFIAYYLGIPSIAVYEVATFYEMFDLEPPGKCKITLCTNLPCVLSGANEAAAHLRRKFNIGFGETSADGKVTLKQGECFGACGDAPVMLIDNHRMCSFMTPEKIDRFLEEIE